MRRFGPILVVALMLEACTTGTTPSPPASMTTPEPTASATAMGTPPPTASTDVSASPHVTSPSSSPSLPPTRTAKPIPTPPASGWPMVSRAGIAMTGAVTDSGENGDSLRATITVAGLAPGETVTFRATGEYIVTRACGAPVEPCGELGCVPAFSDRTEGSATAEIDAVADADGTLIAPIEIVAGPTAKACPDASTSPWGTMWTRWDRVSIADSVHGLVLTPSPIEWGITY